MTIWLEEKRRILYIILIGIILVLSTVLILTVVKFKYNENPKESNLIEELIAENNEEDSIILDESSSKDQAHQRTETESLLEIVVDIKGEIDSPGVYQLKEGSRVIDVIEKAGGLLSEADTTSVNFAQLVVDQMVIYIPKEGEEAPVNQVNQEGFVNDSNVNEKQIDINKAEKETLMLLNGIGSSKADGIIAYREENGFFQTIEELKNVSGIGEATFEKLKDAVTVTP